MPGEGDGEPGGEHPALAACLAGRRDDLPGLDPGAGGWRQLRDDRGATPVHYAARSGSVEVLRWLVEDNQCAGHTRSKVGATPALDAAATGKTEALAWLLDRGGCAFSDEDDSGATALHLAARYGHVTTVKWLETTFEADLTLTTKAGATPLHFASSRGDLDVVKFLVERNASVVDRQMETGVTAAYLAAQEGHLESLRYLVEEGGAKLTVTSFDGMSCLHAAAQMGRLDCVAWMVVTGKIGINECDFDGASALHFAAGRGHLRVVEWLLVSGARIIQDNIGGSPLHDAAEHGEVKCVRTLLQFGCDPTLKDNNGMTAADLAENCWHRECAATLRRRLIKGVSGVPGNARKRPSLRNYFHNGDYVDMGGLFRGSDTEGTGGSDYVDPDSGSETSSTYVVHTDFSRSSGRSSEGEYYNHFFARLHANGFPRFPIPPPPSWPPPPVPSAAPPGNGENADVTSQQSTTSSQSEAEGYENLGPNEMASLMHMRNAIRHGGGAWNAWGGAWNGGMPIYGAGALTGHEQQNGGDGIHGHAQMNGYGHPIYGTSIPVTRPRPMGRGHAGNAHSQLGGLPRPVLTRYQPAVNQDGEGGVFSRVTMSPRLKEIIERDSEVGSRQASLDALELTNGSASSGATPPSDLPISEATPTDVHTTASPMKMAASSAPATPAHSVAPPPPPPLPPDTFTPPTNSLRWKKMAFGSLPNVSMSGDAAKYLLRPVVKNAGNKKPPNIDLIAELKAANGRQSLKRVKRQQNAVDETASMTGASESEAEAEPKTFWKQLQKRPSSPQSEVGSRRNSIALRPEFDPKNFLENVNETDVLGHTVPAWKKLILARQLAEKAQTAADEQKKVEEEENKYKNLPPWKRALVEKREKEAKEKREKQEKQEKESQKTQNKENNKKKEAASEEKTDSMKSENKLILKKTHKNLEELDNKKSTENPMMAPWQMELKRKKQTLKEGFV